MILSRGLDINPRLALEVLKVALSLHHWEEADGRECGSCARGLHSPYLHVLNEWPPLIADRLLDLRVRQTVLNYIRECEASGSC